MSDGSCERVLSPTESWFQDVHVLPGSAAWVFRDGSVEGSRNYTMEIGKVLLHRLFLDPR